MKSRTSRAYSAAGGGRTIVKSACSMVLVIWAVAAYLVAAASTRDAVSGSNLETFQQFTNGKRWVKEAVVNRCISRADGTVINNEWVRFGFQGSTWYAQRLVPSTNDSTQLVPMARLRNPIGGASFTHLWLVTDTDVHVASKEFATGSTPKEYSGVEYGCMVDALTLGLPHNGLGNIRWSGCAFTTDVVTRRSPDGQPLESNSITGNVILGSNGLPVSAKYLGVGSYAGASLTYEYDDAVSAVPVRITAATGGQSGKVYRWEFLSLSLGEVSLEATGGYVPTMFVDAGTPRNAIVWTNNLPYTFVGDSTVAAFETSNPRRTGSLILATTALTVLLLLALSYRRLTNKPQHANTTS